MEARLVADDAGGYDTKCEPVRTCIPPPATHTTTSSARHSAALERDGVGLGCSPHTSAADREKCTVAGETRSAHGTLWTEIRAAHLRKAASKPCASARIMSSAFMLFTLVMVERLRAGGCIGAASARGASVLSWTNSMRIGDIYDDGRTRFAFLGWPGNCRGRPVFHPPLTTHGLRQTPTSPAP